jgi:hypothetical protein
MFLLATCLVLAVLVSKCLTKISDNVPADLTFFIFAAGSDSDVAKGIVQGHAYAILNATEESDARGNHQLIQLRNPWGSTEWYVQSIHTLGANAAHHMWVSPLQARRVG